ncbi:hypothetical protein KM043_009606 [Ampulex compressa]|nr:hypothetical protein KM043_009606 [Ampulex compressa]
MKTNLKRPQVESPKPTKISRTFPATLRSIPILHQNSQRASESSICGARRVVAILGASRLANRAIDEIMRDDIASANPFPPVEAKPEKFRLESVTGVERRVACYEQNGGTTAKEDGGERDGGRAAKGARGDEPELERWQSIDLVGFTVSFYLSLSFYISTSPAVYGRRGRISSLFRDFDFLAFSGTFLEL